MKYNKILVAVDNTDDAGHVLKSAIEAAQEDAEFHLVNVVQQLNSVYGSMVWSPAITDTHTLEESLVQQSTKHLAELCTRHGLNTHNNHAVLGSPATTIRNLAEELAVNLIVIGTHARHGLGLVLGSTANSVLHGVCTDVLVVRLPTDSDEEGDCQPSASES